MESRKVILMKLLQGHEGDTDVENRLMDTMREEVGEGGLYIESNMETYISIHKIASKNVLYDSGNSHPGSVLT